LEQTGKSLVVDFLQEYVFGPNLICSTANVENISTYTQYFEGKILANINELPCASTGEFMKIMNKMKTLITDNTFDCRAMYQQPRTSKNTFNFILTSNNDAVTISTTNHKRYKMLDVSNSRINDHRYFTTLCKATHTDAAGKAFFLWLKERHETCGKTFNAAIFPHSETFKDKMNDRLDPLYKFIKAKYIRKQRDVRCSLDELFSKFKDSKFWKECRVEKSPIGVSKQLKGLASVQHARKMWKKSKVLVFSAKYKDLFSEFAERGWIHETDNIEFSDATESETGSSAVESETGSSAAESTTESDDSDIETIECADGGSLIGLLKNLGAVSV
jgi:hypothetical protein